ncbi:MAG: hypothetical protein KGL58_02000 [Pseudomonadota bacterium]|nr:hypothetical protein [Pseudomonadota bacterium]
MNRSFYILSGLILSISLIFPATFNLLGALDSTQALVLLSPNVCSFAKTAGITTRDIQAGCDASGEYDTHLFSRKTILSQGAVHLILKPGQIRGIASISGGKTTLKQEWAMGLLSGDLLIMVLLGGSLVREAGSVHPENTEES